MKMMLAGFLTVLLATGTLCSVRTQDNAVNRQIFGSNGPYRDFQLSDCYLPLETNPYCNEWQFAYHWNNALMDCERAIYHGCNRTRNNFITLTACKNQAGPICNRRRH
uniref:Precursor of an antimircobial peptide with kunitz domain n=1 Tax=Acalolepta luxuriosa TaxID=85306 RepID=Q60FC9_ACALU|nr:precursor of an antimircobial peptide with kunitz domain [Acalolepta luxuriosa]